MLLGSERARVAYHEAGHAVVAVYDGLGLRCARLAAEPGVFTNMALNRVAWPCVEERVRFYLAGYAADKCFAPTLASRKNSAMDFEQALALVGKARLQRLSLETEREVAEHWSAVEAVAAALLEREVLSAGEIYRVIVKAR